MAQTNRTDKLMVPDRRDGILDGSMPAEHSSHRSSAKRWRLGTRLCALAGAAILLVAVCVLYWALRRISAASEIRRAGGTLTEYQVLPRSDFAEWCIDHFSFEAYERFLLPLADVQLITFQSAGQDLEAESIRLCRSFPELKYINVADRRLDPAVCQQLAQLPGLEGLTLDRTNVTDEGLAEIGRCMSLNDLSIQGTQLTGSGFAQWPRYDRLTHLCVGNSFHPESWNLLRRFRHLKRLECESEPPSLEFLESLTELRELDINGTMHWEDSDKLDLAMRVKSHCPSLVELNGSKLGWRDGRFFWDEVPDSTGSGRP